MAEKILVLASTAADGSASRSVREAVTAALFLREELPGATLTLGLWGGEVSPALEELAGCGAERFLTAAAPELVPSRYASDAAAADALVRASEATLVLAPNTRRLSRSLPGVALRSGGRLDTRVVALETEGGQLLARRWYYRQRVQATFSREGRPWFLSLEPGVFEPWMGEPAVTSAEEIPVSLAAAHHRTTVQGEQDTGSGPRTIRPEAELLFVAGAGWTKAQAGGQRRAGEAENLILGFLERSQASLGGSKSLVEQGEGEAALSFMSHLNQVGQTGMSPRHPKGLATCCHGEEPHVVGWRFIRERRAVNTDANCGWARGKADVVYVADAFDVMARVNERLRASGGGESDG